MPYPILTLPYPFAKRLRQLLSPFELQDLQIAAGHILINPLKPIVSSQQHFAVRFQGNPIDTTTFKVFRVATFFQDVMINIHENEQYLMKCEKLRLYSLSKTALESIQQNNILIKPHLVEISKSHISNVFLYNVSKFTIEPRDLIITGSGFDEDVTFSTILNIFPHVYDIMLDTAYFGWLHDLSKLGKKLKSVMISFDNFEKIFSFRPEELYNFVEKQGTEFCLQLSVYSDDNYLTDKIKPFIDHRFQPGDLENANVLVAIHSSSSLHLRYTLPGSEKDWFNKKLF